MPQDPQGRQQDLRYYSLPTAEKNGLKGISKLPYSMKVLLENLLRNEDGRTVKKDDIVAVSNGCASASSNMRSPSVRRAC